MQTAALPDTGRHGESFRLLESTRHGAQDMDRLLFPPGPWDYSNTVQISNQDKQKTPEAVSNPHH